MEKIIKRYKSADFYKSCNLGSKQQDTVTSNGGGSSRRVLTTQLWGCGEGLVLLPEVEGEGTQEVCLGRWIALPGGQASGRAGETGKHLGIWKGDRWMEPCSAFSGMHVPTWHLICIRSKAAPWGTWKSGSKLPHGAGRGAVCLLGFHYRRGARLWEWQMRNVQRGKKRHPRKLSLYGQISQGLTASAAPRPAPWRNDSRL